MLFYVAFLIAAVSFAVEEYSEWMEHKDWEKYDRLEKIASVFNRSSLIVTGFLYPYGFNEILFFLVIYWTLTDGLQNILKNRGFFDISAGTMNPIEKFSTWYIKLILFIISILIWTL